MIRLFHYLWARGLAGYDVALTRRRSRVRISTGPLNKLIDYYKFWSWVCSSLIIDIKLIVGVKCGGDESVNNSGGDVLLIYSGDDELLIGSEENEFSLLLSIN